MPSTEERKDVDVLNHANFGLLPEDEKRFGSFGVSFVVNGILVAALIALTITHVHEVEVRRQEQLTYLAEQPKPYIPPPPPKVKMPPIPPMPKPEVARIIPPPPAPVPEPPKVEPIKVATKAPEMPAPAPRPVARPAVPVVGAFHDSTPAPATAVKVAPKVEAAGFGAPTGVTANPNANRPATIAAVGGFGSTNTASTGAAAHRGVVQGTGFGSGLGAGSPNGSAHGTVASTGFGSGAPGGTPGGHGNGAVATTGFGAGAPSAGAGAGHVQQQPITTSIVVLSKPLPQYTAEAKEQHIEGDVTLEVRFTADGQVEVLRVINGLGHGLDEQARLAAQRIRFKPATKDGKPVDQVSVIHVAFQLA